MKKKLKKISNLIKKAMIFYLKDIKKADYFTITIDGKISRYVFLGV